MDGEFQWCKGIDHDCIFVRIRLSDAGFDLSRLRPMGNTHGMKGYRPLLDTGPGHEVAADIINDFITVHVGVKIGRRNRLGMEIEQPGSEVVNVHISGCKYAVDRRRLVGFAHNGDVIVNIEIPKKISEKQKDLLLKFQDLDK